MTALLAGSKVALYARVSTDDKNQDPENQLLALRQLCTDAGWEIFGEYIDRARAKDYQRRMAWARLQKDVRSRKVQGVIVFRLDRAFRSVRECVNLIEDWTERGIAFKSAKEDIIDTTTSSGRFMLQVMAAMAELESSVIGERVAAGMARTKAQGNRVGRRPLALSVNNVCDTLERCCSVSAAAKELGCSRGYIYKAVPVEKIQLLTKKGG